jgi:tRNA dimethylallyltransferase
MAHAANLLVILGPTGSGKSQLATVLARRTGAEILSVDSMQVYQHMDIGTAKPSLLERHEIFHHLIDWVRPDEVFSVARFVELADEVIHKSQASGKKLIATGGTPLYYKALFQGLFDGPSADLALRERLSAIADEELHQRLAEVDPPAAMRIHVADRRRMIRALEIHELTGQPISTLQKEWESPRPHRHRAVWVGILWDRDAINRRINARVKDMIAAGWLDEVRDLLRVYPNLSQTAAEATGYKELIDHMNGLTTLDEAIEEIKIATRQLARRQMKWFKRFAGVHWIPGDSPLETNVETVLRLWESAD